MIDIWHDAALGTVMPLLIALVNQAHWPPKLKALEALLLCFAVSALTVWLHGQADWHHLRNTVLVIGGVAFAAYQLWWKPSTWAPAIEAATTLSRPSRGVTP